MGDLEAPRNVRQRHYKNHVVASQMGFFTSTCLDFAHLFVRPEVCSILLQDIRSISKQMDVKLYGYVVMPHHVHILARMPENVTGSDWIRRWKSVSSLHLLPVLRAAESVQLTQQVGLNRNQLWMRSYRSIVVLGDAMVHQKMNYIHQNPVRAGLVKSAVDFGFSSARMVFDGKWSRTEGLLFDED